MTTVGAHSLRQVGPELSVAGQLDPAAMAWAASLGFRSVINNRPDYEAGPEQPTNSAMAAAAAAAGLKYAYLPVAPAYQSPQEIARMAELVATLPKPILAFCRSGARSGKLYQASQQR